MRHNVPAMAFKIEQDCVAGSLVPYRVVLAWAAAHAGSPRVERAEAEPGRVLAEAVIAPHAVPSRAQAATGGVALSATTTHGAGEYAPALVPARRVIAGDTLLANEDAVVPSTSVDWVGPLAAVAAPVAAGTGCCAPGGVIEAGVTALPAGAVLGAAAMGLLAAMGILRVTLVRPPRVALLAPPALTPLLTAAITADGGVVEALPDAGAHGAEWARAGQFDLIIAVGSLPGATLNRGVAIQPGEQGAFGDLDGVPAVCVPADAEAALAAFLLLARPVLWARAGRHPQPVSARLTAPISSALGYTQIAWLRLDSDTATPAGHGLHAATAGAHTIIPADSEGLAAGAQVDAWT